DYQMPAYVFERGKEERRKQQEEFEKIRQLTPDVQHIRGVRITEQYAVLVGDFKDEQAARKALDDFKKLQRPPDKFCDKVLMQAPTEQDGRKGYDVKQVPCSPFLTSFVIHNPTVPLDKPDDSKELDFLKKINAGESLSILNTPKSKPYTLLVKEFHGIGMI